MSNETKRDVFAGLLEQYKDTDDELIAERNPIDWVPQQSKQAYKIFSFQNRYDAALPDVGEAQATCRYCHNRYGRTISRDAYSRWFGNKRIKPLFCGNCGRQL